MFKFLINNTLEKYQNTVKQILICEKKIATYSNIELRMQTSKLKKQIAQGYQLEDIQNEAFATVKEAIKRSTGMSLFNVQLIGGLVLHEGKIAEMKTGEGKTLVALLAGYLNTLTKKSVHIITVNDYLAKRDSLLARKVYNYLNITVGLIENSLTYEERKLQYQCDIVYITNNELGFDYLRDNMAIDKQNIVQTEFHFAIIDEVDSILIDEARTPLIISGPFEAESHKYQNAEKVSQQLEKNVDYDIDEKSRTISLTEQGITKCEKTLEVKNLYNINNSWTQYIINALKAKELFLNNVHYIVKNNSVIIVDEFTGRIMEGRRWSDGLHQAIEAKEKTTIQQENKTLASITYQNLFLLYNKLSGMTGTAKTEELELDKIYRLEVVEIPTNKICKRKDLPDLVYKTEYSKWQAVANECFDMYQIGRPTLIGTTNVEKSELLAQMLDELEVPYNLLNAKPENISRESEIISQAGKKFTITISTNMAGRGTDIILGGNPTYMSKILLTKYIKGDINLDNIKNNYYINTQQKIILQKFNSSKTSNVKNTQEYIDNIINHQDKMTDNDKEIYEIYTKLQKEYSKMFNNEKEEILKLGGLYVIGTERHESRRIDNQLRGRAGRQGDIGSSRFFLSLQDNLLRIFGGDKIFNLMQSFNLNDNTPIESTILSKSLNSAQKKVESYFFDIRKQLFEYDEVINNQRQAIYTERKRILESTFTRDCIIEYAESTIDEILSIYEKQDDLQNKIILLNQTKKLLNLNENFNSIYLTDLNFNQIKTFLYEQLRITYDLRESYLEQLRPGLIRQLEKYYLLQQIDKAWQEHLEKMSLLRESIGWRSYGQEDPLVEYKNEGFNLFINMVTYIRQTVVYLTMRSRLVINIDT